MDRRSSTRRRSLLNGRIIFNNRCSVIECTIKDLSGTGAKIMFAHLHPIPAEFELDIPSKGAALRARVMWSNGKECGIRFDDQTETSQAAEVTETQQRQLARGEAENSAQQNMQTILEDARQRIAQLSGVSVDSVKLTVEIN